MPSFAAERVTLRVISMEETLLESVTEREINNVCKSD